MLEPFIGEIVLFAGNFAPRGWAFCDGQILPVSQNTALFSILGTTYGGDGRTTFALPDLRGRAPIHQGQGPGLTPRKLGQSGGGESETLSVAEIPAHAHDADIDLTTRQPVATEDGTLAEPSGNYLAVHKSPNGSQDLNCFVAAPASLGSHLAPGTASGQATSDVTGGGQGHNNMQPFLTMSYIIALQGIYPSRS